MKFCVVLFISVCLLWCTCNHATGSDADNKGEISASYTEGNNPVTIEIAATTSNHTYAQDVYHAYTVDIDSLHMYFSFKSQWGNNKSYKGVIDYFDYLYLRLHLPSRENDTTYYAYDLNAVWGCSVDSSTVYTSITGYHNDTLTGVIKVKFPYLVKTMQSRDPNCRSGDIMGFCSELLDEPVEYIIHYNVKLEE